VKQSLELATSMEEFWQLIQPSVRSIRVTATSCPAACMEVPAELGAAKNLPVCAPCCFTIADSLYKDPLIASLT